MKRFLVLLVALGILVAADRVRFAAAQDEKKDKEEKKDKDKKDEKDKDKKEEKDKDKDKAKKDDKPLTEEQKKELTKLSGTFAVIEFEVDGKKKPADELKKMKVVQKGAEWSFQDDSELTQGKDTPFPDKTPKEIDALYTNGSSMGKVVKGIYTIDGDTITYCWADIDKPRPTKFETTANSGLTVMKLKRMKDEEKKDKDGKDKKEEKKDKKEEKSKDKEEKKDK